MEITADKFYERLEYWLDKKDLSTYRLWKMSGISTSTLYNGKNEKRHLSIDTAGKVINALGLSAGQFFGESDFEGFDGAMLEIRDLSKDFSPEQMKTLVSYAKFINNEKK